MASNPIAPALKPPRAAERIRQSARELFYRDGIRAVGVEEIVGHAGVTKPSLYRSFASKDDLATAYLRLYDREFWDRFDDAAAKYPGDARAQLLDYLTNLAARAQKPGYRGCGLTNAAVEYPTGTHPARLVAEENKRAFRRRLRAMAKKMGASSPDQLGDGVLLLIEGTFTTGQMFGAGGPAVSLPLVANRLIDAYLTA